MASTVSTIKIDDNDFERIIPLMQVAAGITPVYLSRMDDATIPSAIKALEVAAGVTPLHLQLDRKDWVAALVGVQIKLNQRTATISIATPAVVTLAAHGFPANQPVRFQSTGALPTGLVIGPTYYVVGGATLLAGSFNVSGSPGGPAINTTGTQSGVHVVFPV